MLPGKHILVLRMNYMPFQPTPTNKNKILYEPLTKIIYLPTTNVVISHNKAIKESMPDDVQIIRITRDNHTRHPPAHA